MSENKKNNKTYDNFVNVKNDRVSDLNVVSFCILNYSIRTVIQGH